jgi:hypothetical protein
MKTKYGTAKIGKDGYYRITSMKEGNNGKILHRLIARDYFGDWIDEPLIDGEKIEIHHIDGNPLNNCVLNLLPLSKSEHLSLHKSGENNPMYGKTGENSPRYGEHHSEESKQKMSEANNTSGYLNVCKQKNKTYKQGFQWVYRYSEDGKRKRLTSVDIKKLESKVKARGLPWKKLKNNGG